jgi:hypothetical protein
MIGEISIGGVYLPTFLLLVVAALVLTGIASRLIATFGLYRFVAYRPIVDLALYLLILGLLALLTGPSL